VRYPHGSRSIGRREFIKSGASAGLGVGLALADAASASISRAPQVRRYAPLGRTGMRISDISFGADRLSSGDENLAATTPPISTRPITIPIDRQFIFISPKDHWFSMTGPLTLSVGERGPASSTASLVSISSSRIGRNLAPF
jgi:hypothetical protein